MRFDVWAAMGALIVTVGLNAPSAAAKAPKDKSSDDAWTAYQRYLDLARATKVEPDASRWVDSLMADPRAHAVNDLLTVNVVESVNASGTADSSVNKDGSSNAAIGTLFGKKVPGLSPIVDSSSTTKFKGGGSTNRADQLTGTLTVRVAEVLPNGNLVLEGAREVQINGERQLFVLTGIVRAVDVGPNNVVVSTAIAQLHVQYVGSGLLKDSLKPGVISRLLNKLF